MLRRYPGGQSGILLMLSTPTHAVCDLLSSIRRGGRALGGPRVLSSLHSLSAYTLGLMFKLRAHPDVKSRIDQVRERPGTKGILREEAGPGRDERET
ncbi:hypothetical protein C8Q73DRAFT_716244 [Cubamyces lactineus]|nr:hypothetical protein C8Q73DRAFT_716244 [Cubamyces lactineus]